MNRINDLSNSSDWQTLSQDTTIDIKGTLDFINEILGNTTKAPNRFALSFISRRYKAIRIESFESLVKEIVETQAQAAFTNTKFYDTITVFKNISIGLDKPVFFYDYSGSVRTLDEISGTSDILRLDSDYLPVFYIYILIKEGDAIVKERRESLLIDIGKAIGNRLKEKIIEELQLQIEQMEG